MVYFPRVKFSLDGVLSYRTVLDKKELVDGKWNLKIIFGYNSLRGL